MAITPPRKPKTLTLVAFVVSLIVSLTCTYLLFAPEETKEWPFTAVDTADEVPLSRFKDILTEDGAGRRVAILKDKILIEMVEGAGDVIAEEEPFFNFSKPDDAEELDAEGEEIEGDVLSVDIPRYNDPFLNDLIREDLGSSNFEVGVFADDAGLTGLQKSSIAFQILFVVLIAFMVLKMMGVGGSSFGTERGYSIIQHKDLPVGLKDVAGLDAAREGVEEVIGLLRDEGDVGMAGGRLPRGMLLDGPPGTGKTLMARAMAKEAGVNFISIDASSLNQMFVGLGAMKIRSIFRKARKLAPCIIFIDEIDAMGRARGSSDSSGARESDATLNALLTELDGFDARAGIFIIAATNRAEILDPALTRPGRIDRKITLTLPDIKAREEILAVHCRDKTLGEDVNLHAIAATVFQTSGAELENLVNEAALAAGREGRKEILMEDFTTARDRLLLPQSGGSIKLLEDERQLTAVHEAGHAVIALGSEHSDPVEKVTITPQGAAMGFVLQSPERDRVFETVARLKARLRVAVAGREAERLIFGPDMITTGAASDIRQATQIARAMVTTYGMSELGFMVIDPKDPTLFDMNNPPSRVIAKIIDEAIDDVRMELKERRDGLDRLTDALLETETISGVRAREIVEGNMKGALSAA